MTQEDKLLRAKIYADKLASGIDPISNRAAPKDSVLNQPRLLRYFSFISEVLNERVALYNQKELTSVKSQFDSCAQESQISASVSVFSGESYFQITQEALDSIILSDEPIPISNLARRIQVKAAFGSKHFSHRWATNWLISNGYLYLHSDSHKRIPTTSGTKLGIFQELRPSKYGNLLITLYRKEAQKFILDHISEILHFNGYYPK